jgi:CheY-like chemotaxis protein
MSRETVEQKRALVIEDDPCVRELITHLLSEHGYLVAEASNGFAGLRLVDHTRPDVVVLDLALPEISGFEVLDELHDFARTQPIPVVVVTASCSRLPERYRAMVQAVLGKPFAVDELLGQVDRATGALAFLAPRDRVALIDSKPATRALVRRDEPQPVSPQPAG